MAKVFLKQGPDEYAEINVVGVEGMIEWIRQAELSCLFGGEYDELDFTLIVHGKIPGEGG